MQGAVNNYFYNYSYCAIKCYSSLFGEFIKFLAAIADRASSGLRLFGDKEMKNDNKS